MTRVYPLPLAAFTAACTEVKSPWPRWSTYRVFGVRRAAGDPYRPNGRFLPSARAGAVVRARAAPVPVAAKRKPLLDSGSWR
jgi:hypothetical protein